ncbi:hypothetical protein QR680_001809 [Steinernema hermaphroditum]|uniref:Transthyretin-like protein 46 n=1 Tax=Steinernema hermaphroditum TaxID=289476 RepID=A0AA39LGC7_9BILA|nr:hypothetical protein QR680_001809 [Steinernema hermaphroditum]
MYCWLSASLALLLFVQCGAFRRQSVAVRGKLLCGGKPASDILVKLVDDDRGPDPDDLLDSTYTSDEGIFLLKGGTMELTDIDPEIRIYHDCNDHGKVFNKFDSLKNVASTLALSTRSAIIPEQFSGQQSYKVIGRLLCGEIPAKDVRVKLVDDDFGPDPDDDLQSGYTNDEGYFELSGDTTELTTIDPHLKIYHDCNDGITPCQRRWKFELPNHYITKGNKPHNTLDIGTWNLEAKMPGESHDCIH